ncbi:hypothetical protein FRB94_011309 [Tulasnella sp. JGI-2019a]|nr:hypothetical protein FRB94_011309 [Tulasnella sp. JGI-2019a]
MDKTLTDLEIEALAKGGGDDAKKPKDFTLDKKQDGGGSTTEVSDEDEGAESESEGGEKKGDGDAKSGGDNDENAWVDDGDEEDEDEDESETGKPDQAEYDGFHYNGCGVSLQTPFLRDPIPSDSFYTHSRANAAVNATIASISPAQNLTIVPIGEEPPPSRSQEEMTKKVKI